MSTVSSSLYHVSRYQKELRLSYKSGSLEQGIYQNYAGNSTYLPTAPSTRDAFNCKEPLTSFISCNVFVYKATDRNTMQIHCCMGPFISGISQLKFLRYTEHSNFWEVTLIKFKFLPALI
jgi:hypothetical protein